MPMPISAAPAMRKRTPLRVTVAIVATREKNSAANPKTTNSTPKAVIEAHFARSRSIASPRLCGVALTFDMALSRLPRRLMSAQALTCPPQFAQDLSGVFDHRHDAAVVEPRRPDDAEHPGDAMIPGA